MKTNALYLQSIFLCTLLFLFACSKDSLPTDVLPDPVVKIEVSIAGQVLDQNEQPIENAIVYNNATEIAVTDVNGIFIARQVSVPENRAYITVERNGYFHASRAFIPTEDGLNQVLVMLIEEQTIGSFSNNLGGTISTTDGATVEFAANSVELEAGGAYAGEVTVTSYFIDPQREDLAFIMPGDLQAINTEGEENMLQTYGMLAVELYGSAGEKLNLAAGQTATISIPLDPALAATAPSTIPLWYFDELTGVWREEGTAQLNGNSYVGEVSHFSYWNCDAPFPVINLTGSILGHLGIPEAGLYVTLSFNSSNGILSGVGFTDASGVFSGDIPSNTVLDIVVQANPLSSCGSIILYSGTIGPFSSNTVLPAITLPIPSSTGFTPIELTGLVEDCNGNPLVNGYVSFDLQGFQTTAFVTNGQFSHNELLCFTPQSAIITAYDLNNSLLSSPTTVSLNFPTTNVGTLTTCDSLTQFITLDLGADGIYNYDVALCSLEIDTNTNMPVIRVQGAFSSSQSISFDMSCPPTVGTHQVSTLWLNLGNVSLVSIGFTATIDVTQEAQNVGDNFEATITGGFEGQNAAGNINFYPMNISISAIRGL